MKFNIIEITLNNGRFAVWNASKGEWSDFHYDGSAFCIKKDDILVAVYSISNIVSVVIR